MDGLAAFIALIASALTGATDRPAASVRLDAEPRRVHYVAPEYPPAERTAGVEADIFVPVHVNAAGEVYWAGSQPGSPLHDAAAAAVRKWRYEPSKALARSFSARVRFRLPHKLIHAMAVGAVFDQWLGDDLAARAEALRELGDRGTAIMPFLETEVVGKDLVRRCGAAHLAAGVGRDARRMGPALVPLVHETAALDRLVGWCPSAGGALAAVDRAAFTAELERAVRSRDARLCRTLVPGARHLPDLTLLVLAALRLEGCSDEAAMALPLLALSTAEALPELIRAAGVVAPFARQTVIGLIGRTLAGTTGTRRQTLLGEAMPALVAALNDPEKGVRAAAVDGLAGLGADASLAVAPLARAIEDPSRNVRWRVLLALTAMGRDARAAGPALLAALESPLPPEENRQTGLTDEVMRENLRDAIATTGAGKDDATLAVEDEMHAAVVAHLVRRAGTAATPDSFAVKVMKTRGAPAGLLRALAGRGLKPVGEAISPRVTVNLGEITWRGGDQALVDVNTDYGMSGGFGSCRVSGTGEQWQVGCDMGIWN